MSQVFKLAPHEWARLRSLLDDALAMPPEQRAAWIDSLGSTQLGALGPQLRALLAHADEATPDTVGRLLETLPKIETGQFAGAPGAGIAQPGDTVGPYRLVRELGSGGMGVVWQAERTDLLQGRPVALKLPHGAWKRAGLAERMAREREILATLDHPNIARLYDAGVADDGQPWLALELVQGERIDVFCRHLALPVAERVRLALQVVRAVAHAHGRLVVHRDLKPGNVLVTQQDGVAAVKLLDFGIAKLVEQGSAEATALTQAAGRPFTPEYASPEQVLGEPLTTASDIYSLGVLLFELLADVRPYRLTQATRAALEEAIAQGALPRPSALAPAGRRAALRGDLDTIVLKALQRDPARRYATADALADDLQRHLDQRPVLARPDGAGYRLRLALRRHRLAVGAGTAVLLSLLLGTALALWQADMARQEQRRAESVKDFVTAIFTEAAPHTGSGSAGLSAQDLLKRADQRMRATAIDDPAVRVELSALLSAALTSFGDLDAAEALLQQAASVPGLGPQHAQSLRVAVLQAQMHRLRGRAAQAAALLDTTLPPLRQRAAALPREMVTALTHRALIAFEQGAYGDAERFAAEGAELAATRLADDDELRISSPIVLALAYRYTRKFEPARQVSAAALQAALQRHGHAQPHPRVAEARTVHGRALADTGEIAAGVALIDRAVADMRQLYGPGNFLLGVPLQNLVAYRIDIGELASAEANAAEALRILGTAVQAESLSMAGTLAALGQARLARRNAAAALPDLERAAELMGKLVGPQHDSALLTRAGRALAWARLGRHQQALAEAQALQALARDKAVAASTRARIAVVGGTAARLAGDAAAARQWLQPVADTDDPAPRLQRERMHARAELGLALRTAGDLDGARAAMTLALRDADRLETSPTPMRAELEQALADLSAATRPR